MNRFPLQLTFLEINVLFDPRLSFHTPLKDHQTLWTYSSRLAGVLFLLLCIFLL